MLYLIPQTVDRAAERDPDRDAVCFSDQQLSYADLAWRTDQLAGVLGGLGVRRRDRVGVLMNKCAEAAVAIHGAMKARAAYVPLDATAPPARLAAIARDCGIRHLISHPLRAATVRGVLACGAGIATVVGIDRSGLEDVDGVEAISWDEVAAATAARPDGPLIEDDLAYIIYTSGSTGVPKGIMHTHRSGLHYARWVVHEYGLVADDRLTNHAPLHFDMSTFDYFGASAAGATTVVVPEMCMMLPASYSQLLERERISVFFTVPFALAQLLHHGALDHRDLSSLRRIVFGGDVSSTRDVRALMLALPHTGFSHMYGPAETNGCMSYDIPSVPEASEVQIPIGRAATGMEVRVIAADGTPVGPGEIGELLVRGPTVMQGYWGRADLDARAFRRRKVAAQFAEVEYCTGDLAALLPDGNLRFCGRKDRQIKVRGYRVELDEVELVLEAHPMVREAAVFPVEGTDATRTIDAVVTRSSVELEGAALLEHVRTRLPAYAVPARIEFVESMPLSSTGKIDRLALQRARSG